MATVEAARRERIREALISWFEENGRDLPWRCTRDPWRVFVSEVMLQQIQVKRAVPFYERFLARFPTVDALVDAPRAEAIRVWEDLGRYRRIVYLHETARIVVGQYDSSIPSDPDDLLKLPGVAYGLSMTNGAADASGTWTKMLCSASVSRCAFSARARIR